MKTELIAIGKFLGVSILGGCVALLAGFSIGGFLAYALLTAMVQVLVGVGMNHYSRVKHEQYAYEQRLDEEGILAANSIEVRCAACNTPHSIPIIINQRNLFSCRKCEQENVIIVSAETALTTKPIE